MSKLLKNTHYTLKISAHVIKEGKRLDTQVLVYDENGTRFSGCDVLVDNDRFALPKILRAMADVLETPVPPRNIIPTAFYQKDDEN